MGDKHKLKVLLFTSGAYEDNQIVQAFICPNAVDLVALKQQMTASNDRTPEQLAQDYGCIVADFEEWNIDPDKADWGFGPGRQEESTRKLRCLRTLKVTGVDYVLGNLSYEADGQSYTIPTNKNAWDLPGNNALYLSGDVIEVRGGEAKMLLELFPGFFTEGEE
jgi:hypothetical protein